MSRSLLAAAVAALVLAAAPALNAQARPDFSGRWTLVAERSTPAGASAFGNALTIEQTPAAVIVEAQMDRVRFASGPTGSTMTSAPGGMVKTVFNTDGTDHRVDETIAASAAPGRGEFRFFNASDRATDRTYRAVWTRSQLIIMTHETISIARNQGDPMTVRRMIRRSLALEKDGSLIAESLIVADPVPAAFFFFNVNEGPDQAAPIPVRSVYRKAQ